MGIKQFYEKYIYRLFCSVFLSSALVVFINQLTGINDNNALIITLVVIFSALSVLFNIFLKNVVLYITIGAVIIILTAFTVIFNIPVAETLKNSFYWLFNGRSADSDFAFTYSIISIIFTIFLITVFIFNLVKIKYARLGMGVGLFIAVIVLGVMEFDTESFVIFFVFSYIVAVFFEILLKDINYKKGVSYLLPLILIAGFLTSVLPSNTEPIQWTIVKNIANGFRDLAIKIGDNFTLFFNANSAEFGINLTGYSEEGNILGSINPSNREALSIRQSTNPAKSIYLAGTILNEYTGKGWKRTENLENEIISELNLDFLETLLALYSTGLNGIEEDTAFNEILTVRDVDIIYKSLRTNSLFYPLKTLKLNISIPASLTGANLFMDKISDKNTGYHIKYADINYNSKMVLDILKNNINTKNLKNPDTDDFFKFLNKIYVSTLFKELPENFPELLNARSKKIKSQYTELPESVGNRVYKLAKDITKSVDNDYDKLKMLEAYLLTYEYTTTPPEIPDEDFAEWFIFNAKEGYCTYFATAMAVMGRSLGIPMRYVQGYITTFDEKIESNSYLIRDKNAHAWAEAYIEGFGWIPFESSPPFNSVRYSEWRITGTAVGDYTFDFEQYKSETPENEDLTDENEKLSEERQNVFFIFAFIIGVIFIVITGSLTTVFLMNMNRKKKKTDVKNTREFYLNTFASLFMHLYILGKKLERGETLKMFSCRQDDSVLTKIINAHEKIRYNDALPDKADLDIIIGYNEKLAGEAKAKLGRVRYFILEYTFSFEHLNGVELFLKM